MASRRAGRVEPALPGRPAGPKLAPRGPVGRRAGGQDMATFDGVIVGAGHNSLTLGAYMARAGLRVCVLERAPHIGGGCSTEEPILPGFRCNLHSNFYIGFSTAPLMRDLELQRFGFSYIEPPVQHGVALRDGTALVLHKDVDKSCASLARFSKRDADSFRHLHETYGVKMRPFFTATLYNPPLAPEAMRDRLSGPEGRAMLAHAPLDLFRGGGQAFRGPPHPHALQAAHACDDGRERAGHRPHAADHHVGADRRRAAGRRLGQPASGVGARHRGGGRRGARRRRGRARSASRAGAPPA